MSFLDGLPNRSQEIEPAEPETEAPPQEPEAEPAAEQGVEPALAPDQTKAKPKARRQAKPKEPADYTPKCACVMCGCTSTSTAAEMKGVECPSCGKRVGWKAI